MPQPPPTILDLNNSSPTSEIQNESARPLFKGAITKVGTYVARLLVENSKGGKIPETHVYTSMPEIPIEIPKSTDGEEMKASAPLVEKLVTTQNEQFPAIACGEWREQRNEPKEHEYYVEFP